MNILRNRSTAAIAMAAALSLAATPAAARGWGHRHHDRGLDAGDVLAGLLVIGGIAAIASAASSKNKQNRDSDYRYPRADDRAGEDSYRAPPADYRNDDRPERDGYGDGARIDRRLDRAVESCVDEVENGDRRVDSIDSVNREGDGWRVQGRAEGRDFACSVDRDGRVRDVSADGL